MVPEEGVARLSLGGRAIGLCGAAPGFRAPKVALFLLFVGARSRFAPHGPALGKRLVPEEGVEPSRPCGHGVLSPARLPVPPLRRRFPMRCIFTYTHGNGKSKASPGKP